MAQDCPQCGLVNPSTATRCDCGYDLLTRPRSKAPVVGWSALLSSFDGRIGRSTYWRFVAPYMAIGVALQFIDWLLDTRMTKAGGMFFAVFFAAALYPSIAVGVKRCHDRDHSWWFLLLSFIPIANLVLLFELAFMPGTPGPNRYGLPEGTAASETPAPVTTETSALRCPECSTPYLRSDYRSDAPKIYCSACKAELPTVGQQL